MKNSFGRRVTLTLFGESHGGEIGAVLDGMDCGISVDEEYIASRLALRRPFGDISTQRTEKDDFRFISGIYNGKTTGQPICVIIPNKDFNSAPYEELKNIARPGHADYTSYIKYEGYNDTRGGGHFSGRLTAPIVALGAIAQYVLKNVNIKIGTHIKSIYNAVDADFSDIENEITMLENKQFAVIDDLRGEQMKRIISEASQNGNSVGGVLECAVCGLPAGLGGDWFEGVESLLSEALFGIPGVKGVSFGDGFGFANKTGLEANDEFITENGKIKTKTNHNGGINGGITNGMPLIFSVCVKPVSSVSALQNTVDFVKLKETQISINGRHDPCIVQRARAVVDSVAALVVCDLLCQRYGERYLHGGLWK